MNSKSPRFPPVMQSTYDESYGAKYAQRKHQVNPPLDYAQPAVLVPVDRYQELESRLEVQEKTTQQLLDRAIKVKQDLMESLQFNQGSWNEEKEARELLQEHIRTITAVVRQINKDMKQMGEDFKSRDMTVTSTGTNLKTMENATASAIADLRNRVARCDAGISKLATDIRQASDTIRTNASTGHDEIDKVTEKFMAVDNRIMEVAARIDKLYVEINSNVRQTGDETNRNLIELDSKTRQLLEEVRHQLISLGQSELAEREKMDVRLQNYSEKLFADVTNRIEKVEEAQRNNTALALLQENVDALAKDNAALKAFLPRLEKDIDRRLAEFAERVEKQQTEDLLRVKREMRDGFGAVHETVNNMKSVLEGKLRLLEETLRREIGQVRKMVVLI